MTKPSVLLLALALFAGPAHASPRDRLLVTPAWLAAHARDPDLVVLFAGEKSDFDAKHIPSSVFAPVRELAPAAPSGLLAELPPAEDLRRRLQALGVSDRSRIVVYAGREMPYATRVLYTLDAVGLGARASLLDGGLGEWERTGRPVTAEVKAVAPGALAAFKLKPHAVDAGDLQGPQASKVHVIDARAGAFYDGVQAGMGAPGKTAKGHLPGARSLPYTAVVDAAGKLKPAAELQALFRTAGVRAGDKVVAYCHIGYQATAVVYAARTLGLDAALYDGSFQDWAGRGLPLELPAAGK